MKIHVVMQFDSNDCGVACASSICAHYGKEISLSRLRSMMGTETYGTTVKGLVKGLEGIGFNVRAVSTPKESIAAGDYTMPAVNTSIDLMHFRNSPVICYGQCQEWKDDNHNRWNEEPSHGR